MDIVACSGMFGHTADMASLVTPSGAFGPAAVQADNFAEYMAEHRPDPFAGLDDDHLMKPGEVAAIMRVDPKTVTRWANGKKIDSVRTIGGHRRFYVRELRRMLSQKG